MLSRRKRAAPPQYDSGYQDQRTEEPYQPTERQHAPRAPAPMPPPAASVPARAPAPGDAQKAKEAMENIERLLQDADSAGLDTAKARQSLKVARNFFKMGKYDKAMQYCKTAEENIQ